MKIVISIPAVNILMESENIENKLKNFLENIILRIQTILSAKTDAIAAPIAPYLGIKIKLQIKLIPAAIKAKTVQILRRPFGTK